MPADALLASVHFRIQLAGQSLEVAIAFLNGRRVFRGLEHIRSAVGHLQVAAAYLKGSGQYPTLSQYVAQLVQFYESESAKVMRPANAPTVAQEILANQYNLLQADPVLVPASAH